MAAYRGAARLGAIRSDKIAEMLRGQRCTLDTLLTTRMAKAPQGFDYWFHAASLGEFEQARPLIEAIKAAKPETTVLVTFFSPSGYRVRKNYAMADAVEYLPLDRPDAVRRFLDLSQPHRAVFVKYEFWAGYLRQLRRRNIPTYIVSAIFRDGQPFFKPWGSLWRDMLHCFDGIFVQDNHSLELLRSIGCADRAVVAGDTRFDRVADIRRAAKPAPLVERFAARQPFNIVVGSSWQADEEHYIPWLHAHPEVGAIIAPHEFDAHRLERLTQALGPDNCQLYSQLTDQTDLSGKRYLIIDCFGLLSSIYRYGRIALVGGGFGASIHNINEAAVYGMPVLFGPKHQKFKEAYDLIDCGGGFSYPDTDTLNTLLDLLYTDAQALDRAGQAAGAYIADNVGASAKILPVIFPA